MLNKMEPCIVFLDIFLKISNQIGRAWCKHHHLACDSAPCKLVPILGHFNNNARWINGTQQVANCGIEGYDRLITSYLNYDSGLVEKDCWFTFIIFTDSTRQADAIS